jgi:hypothetical protein
MSKKKKKKSLIPPPGKFVKKSTVIAEISRKRLGRYMERGKVYFPLDLTYEELQSNPDTIPLFAIRTTNRRGRSGDLSNVVQLVMRKAPPAPTGLSFALTEGLCSLDWDGVEAGERIKEGVVEGYNVYRKRKEDKIPILPVNATLLEKPVFEDRSLAYGTTYCYTIATLYSTKGESIEGLRSKEICLTPQDVYTPGAPEGLFAITGRGFIRLVWDPNTDRDLQGYNIYRRESVQEEWRKINKQPVRDETYTDEKVTPEKLYYYRITAVDNAEKPNESYPSEEISDFAL